MGIKYLKKKPLPIYICILHIHQKDEISGFQAEASAMPSQTSLQIGHTPQHQQRNTRGNVTLENN